MENEKSKCFFWYTTFWDNFYHLASKSLWKCVLWNYAWIPHVFCTKINLNLNYNFYKLWKYPLYVTKFLLLSSNVIHTSLHSFQYLHAMGWTVCLHTQKLEPWHAGPQHMTLFGDVVISEVIEWKWSHWDDSYLAWPHEGEHLENTLWR